MKMVFRISPNFNQRPPGTVVSCVVLHATASKNTAGDVEWCCTPKPRNPNPVSYHAIVDRDGTVYRLVEAERRAWHAGVSSFEGRSNVNAFSLGLSFANKNDGVEPYTDEQYAAAAETIAGWVQLYPAITRDRVTTHAAIAQPKGRKTDPAGFDVDRLLNMVRWPGNGS